MFKSSGTIIACSTSLASNAAIGIIRLSALRLEDFNAFFSIDLINIPVRQATKSLLVFNSKVIDDVILLFFKAPNSYTGENVLEIHCHGNLLNIDRILSLFIKTNLCKIAQAGEFSYRALKNKKMNYSQIEGLESLLNAKSSLMLDEGLSLMGGELNSDYQKLHKNFLNLKSSIDIITDFSEDVGEENALNNLKSKFDIFSSLVSSLYKRSELEIDSFKRARITIFGETNAGKSTFFNYLIGKKRSIVSNIHGTTRDYVSETININGELFEITDTAGIRQSLDIIEAEGINHSKSLLSKSFYKILIVNICENKDQLDESIFKTSFDLVVFSHVDAVSSIEKNRLEYFVKNDVFLSLLKKIQYKKISFSGLSGPIEPVNLSGPIEPVNLIKNYSDIQEDIIFKYKDFANKKPILNHRHKKIIKKTNDLVCELSNILKDDNLDYSLLSFFSQKISFSIEGLIGIINLDESVNNIFKNFCIGK